MADTNKPSSAKTTLTEVQKLLSDPKDKIQLHKLVQEQTEVAYKSVETLDVQVQDVLIAAKKAIKDFEATTSNLRATMAYGCYFGTPEQSYLWSSALSRLSTVPQVAGSVFLLRLQYYPAMLAFYAGGLSALAAKNPDNLKALFSVKASDRSSEPHALALEANCILLENAGNQVFETERLKTPLSDHLYDLFNDTPLKELAFGQDLERLFDEWEILVGMVVADILKNGPGKREWAPVGRFGWREHYSGGSTLKTLKKELGNDKVEWLPLKAGLFDGSLDRAREALSIVENIADRVSFL